MNKGAKGQLFITDSWKRIWIILFRSIKSFITFPVIEAVIVVTATTLVIKGNEMLQARYLRMKASAALRQPLFINPVDEYGLKRFSYDDSLQVILQSFTLTINRSAYMGTGSPTDSPNAWLLYEPIASESILPQARFTVGGSWRDTASPSTYCKVISTLEVGHGFTISSTNYDLLVEFVKIHDSEITGNLLLRCGGNQKSGVKIIEAN